jgi:hypothetical protein
MSIFEACARRVIWKKTTGLRFATDDEEQSQEITRAGNVLLGSNEPS